MTWLVHVLRRLANSWAAFYGGPVYVVGSALQLADPPGDIDIRIILQPHDVERLFGLPKPRVGCEWWDDNAQSVRWLREQLKQSRRAARAIGKNVDLQFQSAAVFDSKRYAGRARFRLDTMPDEIFTAGLGSA